MAEKEELKYKIIFLLIFILVTFTAEFFYRDPLFDNSVKIAKKLQDALEFTIKPFKAYTYIAKIDYYWLILIILFFPVQYSYTFFLAQVVEMHVCNIAKVIYGQARPFLLDGGEQIRQACEKSYGNPSGHSFGTTTCYLGLCQLVIDYYKLKNPISAILYAVTAFIIVTVNFSRVVLGVHSFNQVIFGDTFGFTLFFIIYHLIQPHKRKVKIFFDRFTNIPYLILNAICFCFVIGYIFLANYLFNREDENSYNELFKNLQKQCHGKKETILTRKSISKTFYITGYFGMIIGMALFSRIITRKYNSRYKEANNYQLKPKLIWYISLPIRVVLLAISYVPFIVMKFVFHNTEDIYFNYIVEKALPMFFFGFLLFGPYLIFNVFLEIANRGLYNQELTSTIKDGDYLLGEEDK